MSSLNSTTTPTSLPSSALHYMRKPFHPVPEYDIFPEDTITVIPKYNPSVLTSDRQQSVKSTTMNSPIDVATSKVTTKTSNQIVGKGKEAEKRKSRKPRNTSYRSMRTIFKEMDETYKAKDQHKEMRLSRTGRVGEAVKQRGVTKRNVYAWAKTTMQENLMKYRDSTSWQKNLQTSLKDENQLIDYLKKPSLSDRKHVAQHISQSIFNRLITLTQANTLKIIQAPSKQKGTYSPKHASVIALIDMTTEQKLTDVLSLYLHGSETLNGDTFATIFISMAKAGSALSVPITITRFSSYLDNPQIAWKSIKGTKASTLRLFHDREGIHTGALQDLDLKVERFADDYKMKMIVVHDNAIDMSAIEDVVTTPVEGIIDTIAGRLRGMGLSYVE